MTTHDYTHLAAERKSLIKECKCQKAIEKQDAHALTGELTLHNARTQNNYTRTHTYTHSGGGLHMLEDALANEGLDLVASHEEYCVALQVHDA
jgi:hypothetical protein|mmetsp:Transcript_59744/g.50613  ORF Transcript_59744/g.50613 Transcript_59744/m.50613 type:complete len:93 (-) Transcript_59744:689-967(-)